MVGLSTQGEKTVLDALLAAAYVSLHTADPGDAGANEIAGNGYARQGPLAFTSTGNNPTVRSNSAVVAYPTATATWGALTHFGTWTALSGGSYLGGQALTTPRTILGNDVARFLIGALQITAD